MVKLATLQQGDLLWKPYRRQVGMNFAPSAAFFKLLDIREDGQAFFLRLQDEDMRVFTIGVVSPSGYLDSFYLDEFDAVKAAVLSDHDGGHSSEFLQIGYPPPSVWEQMVGMNGSALRRTVLVGLSFLLGGMVFYRLFFTF